jgi:(4S)-4-hydroxy-5-phosphonooxypentane-2,3-dione isomerase
VLSLESCDNAGKLAQLFNFLLTQGFTMQVTLVHVQVKPDHIDDFIVATRLNHQASIKEPGNLRFDILQSPDNHSQFILYEAYVNAEAAAAHKETAHYMTWRDTVADWMTEPRQGIRYDGLFPQG